jgi:hypothetical protein
MAAGAPFDQVYADEFLKPLLAEPEFERTGSIAVEMRAIGQGIEYVIRLK